MIIIRVPLRISFMGGGSDLPAFYGKSPGRVISTAIDKYVFVALNKKFDGQFRIGYSITEMVARAHEIKNTRVRAALEHFGVTEGLEIVSIGDVPSSGTGLGASSSFAVALAHGISEFLKHPSRNDKQAIAEAACSVEMDLLGEQIGKQDQYAAAFGGLNVIDFKAESVLVKPVVISQKRLQEFKNNLIVFYVGGARNAANHSHVLSHNLVTDEKRFLAQQKMVDQVVPFKNALAKGDFQVLGEMMHDGWLLKKKTSALISNVAIDELYRVAQKNGAWGGKLLGAGGGGFMLFVAPPARHGQLRKTFNKLKELPFNFDTEGSTVLFNRYAANEA